MRPSCEQTNVGDASLVMRQCWWDSNFSRTSRKKRNPPNAPAIIICYALAGALGGLIHAASIGVKWWSVPAGWGGKAGTCAFAGVAIFRGIEKIVYAIRKSIWGEPKVEYPEIY